MDRGTQEAERVDENVPLLAIGRDAADPVRVRRTGLRPQAGRDLLAHVATQRIDARALFPTLLTLRLSMIAAVQLA